MVPAVAVDKSIADLLPILLALRLRWTLRESGREAMLGDAVEQLIYKVNASQVTRSPRLAQALPEGGNLNLALMR
jgi:hypothetical protein